MSHAYGNGYSNGNNYLNKKRLEDDIPMDNRYHYYKYEKFEKYGNHCRNNNMNYGLSKAIQGNKYNNTSSIYRTNYGNSQKTFHNNGYSNKLGPKRDYKKPYQKYSYQNINEGIRNLSYCDLPSTPTFSFKCKQDRDSLKSISSSTACDSNSYLIDSNSGFNIKNINKLISNISPFGKDKINYHEYLPKLKYKEKKISTYKEENKKWRKEEDEDDDDIEEIPNFKFPQLPEKLINYEPFRRNSIKLEENPLENFEICPDNLYELNIHYLQKKQNNVHITELINNNIIGNILSIKSCYLLAKIPNWRLVTNFVPASLLTSEKFKNIKPLKDENKDNDRKEELVSIETENKNEEEKKNKPIKSHLVYSEKFEEIVEKTLEQLANKKKQVKKDIFNKKYIISQYHYDILKLKNKIKQNIYKINYLNIKQENTRSVIEEKMISFWSFSDSFCI